METKKEDYYMIIFAAANLIFFFIQVFEKGIVFGEALAK